MFSFLELILDYIRPRTWTPPTCDAPEGKGCIPLGDLGL